MLSLVCAACLGLSQQIPAEPVELRLRTHVGEKFTFQFKVDTQITGLVTKMRMRVVSKVTKIENGSAKLSTRVQWVTVNGKELSAEDRAGAFWKQIMRTLMKGDPIETEEALPLTDYPEKRVQPGDRWDIGDVAGTMIYIGNDWIDGVKCAQFRVHVPVMPVENIKFGGSLIGIGGTTNEPLDFVLCSWAELSTGVVMRLQFDCIDQTNNPANWIKFSMVRVIPKPPVKRNLALSRDPSLSIAWRGSVEAGL